MNKLSIFKAVSLTLILSFIGLGFYDTLYLHGISLVILLTVGLLFYFSMNIQFNFFVNAVCSLPDEKIMLTFDDGPHPENTPKILNVLKEEQVKAMFFLIGERAEQHPDLVRRIIDEGHLIGGHSYHHKNNFGFLGEERVTKEIMKAQAMLSEIAEEQIRWFRPPFGVTNPNIAKAVTKHQLKVVGWNARPFDTAVKDVSTLVRKVVRIVRPGAIILLHDRLPQTAEALPEIIETARNKGYKFGLIDQIS